MYYHIYNMRNIAIGIYLVGAFLMPKKEGE